MLLLGVTYCVACETDQRVDAKFVVKIYHSLHGTKNTSIKPAGIAFWFLEVLCKDRMLFYTVIFASFRVYHLFMGGLVVGAKPLCELFPQLYHLSEKRLLCVEFFRAFSLSLGLCWYLTNGIFGGGGSYFYNCGSRGSGRRSF